MANVDVELGDVDIIDSMVQRLLLDCEENEENHSKKHPPSIYMVPSVFRYRSPSSFNPRVVSIGPLHKEKKQLRKFEVYKASSVHKLLHREKDSPPPKDTLKLCVEKVNASIDRIQECYGGMKCNDDDLTKMMVMDGCFILHVIHSFSSDTPVVRNMLLLQQSIIYDLLLLENQIPFFVLNDIFHIIFGSKVPLSKFILPVLKFLHPFSKEIPDKYNTTTPDHILGLLHQCMRPTGDNIPSGFSSSSVHCAVDLDRAGVNFKPNKKEKWSLAMEVKSHRIPGLSYSWAKPTLYMPVLRIHDHTELILRNLMVYELSSECCNYITSYVAAMDMLVNTEEDIATLVESKVLVNSLGSNDEAADMINTICKGVARKHLYKKQWDKLDSYWHNGYWPKHLAWLRRTYFSSPWNFIALVAGIFLFGLTVVQTIYATKEN